MRQWNFSGGSLLKRAGSSLLMSAAALFVGTLVTFGALAQLDNGITYQAQLAFEGSPAEGNFDFEFELYDAEVGGNQVGVTVAVDDLIVAEGALSVELDFAAPFDGTQLWIAVSAREGSSTGALTELLPRQKITAAPYALHAEMVALNAISGAEIIDNSVTAAEIAGSAVGASELATNAVDTGAVQDGAITAAKLASNSVGQAEIITSEVQRRITGGCNPGSFVQSVNEDGSLVCTEAGAVKSQTLETLESSLTPEDVVMVLGSDNLPFIAFRDSADGNRLKSIKCRNSRCAAPWVVQTHSAGSAFGVAVAIGDDGYPVMAYGSGSSLSVFDCASHDCQFSDGTSIAFTSGAGASMVIDNGVPLISFVDGNEVRLVRCGDAACENANTFITVYEELGSGVVLNAGKMVLDNAGQPRISFLARQVQISFETASLNLAVCSNANCTARSIETIESQTAVGGDAISIGENGLAMQTDGSGRVLIAYNYDSIGTFDERALRLVRCTSDDCATRTSALTIADNNPFSATPLQGQFGTGVDMILDGAGLPLFTHSYQGELAVSRCDSATCEGDISLALVELSDRLDGQTSVVIGTDGLPVVAAASSRIEDVLVIIDLKVLRCSSGDCVIP
ncbi:MAG: hypothetical protein AAGA23_08145 [Pseudomonadota bacterium]